MVSKYWILICDGIKGTIHSPIAVVVGSAVILCLHTVETPSVEGIHLSFVPRLIHSASLIPRIIYSVSHLFRASSVLRIICSVSVSFLGLICSASHLLPVSSIPSLKLRSYLNLQTLFQLSGMFRLYATSRNQSCMTRVEIRDSWSNRMYIEREQHILYRKKLLIRLATRFNLFIDKIFALTFDICDGVSKNCSGPRILINLTHLCSPNNHQQ